MAENDYLGNITNSRWQSMNSSYLNRTPSWMQGRLPRAQQQTGGGTFRAPNSGATQSWEGGQMHPSLLKQHTASQDMAKGFGQLSAQLGENRDQRQAQAQQQAQQAQQSQRAGQNFYNQYVGLATKAQYQAAFQKAPAPALPSKSMPPPAPGVQPFGTPPQNQAFPAPGTPAPARQPLTPKQQQAVAGVAQNKARSASSSQPAQTPAFTPMQRTPSVMATNRPARTPASPPAPARPPLTDLQQKAIAGVQQMREQRNASGSQSSKTRAQKRSAVVSRIGNYGLNLIDKNLSSE